MVSMTKGIIGKRVGWRYANGESGTGRVLAATICPASDYAGDLDCLWTWNEPRCPKCK